MSESTTVTTVGAFSYDAATGDLTGPAAYMRSREYETRIKAILDGSDVVFRAGLVHSPSVEVAILVSLQTDYAGWLGAEEMRQRFGR